MKISLFIFIVSISFWACKSKPEKVGRGFYNDFVEDLVRHHIHGYLLNYDEYQNIRKKYTPKYESAITDEEYKEIETQFSKEIDILEEIKFSKDVSKCYVELSDRFNLTFHHWATFYKLPFKDEFPDCDSSTVINTLKKPLSNNLKEVESRFFRIGKTPKDSCEVGRISLSEPFFNKKRDKGIIFCIFRHNGRGFSSVFLLIKEGSYWFIKDEEQISIS